MAPVARLSLVTLDARFGRWRPFSVSEKYAAARSPNDLRCSVAAFLDAYNFAKRLKTLRGLTPSEAICRAWAEAPERFRLDPIHLTSGLNT